MATAKWDYTNMDKISSNPYWDDKADVAGPVRSIKDVIEVRDALRQHDKDMEPKHVTYGPKVTQSYSEWRNVNGFK
jgi:hypothetical protein